MSSTTARTTSRIYHEATAAEDLKPDQIALAVICPDLLPTSVSGTLGAGISNSVTKLSDRDGSPITVPVTSSNHIVATWEGASNSRYAPLVRKGESVEIYQVANQDKWYWRPDGRGRNYRTTDRQYMEVPAMDPSKPGGEKDDSNSYSAWIDSDGKTFGVRTSMANGEATAFSIMGNTEDGTFHISDSSEDPGNRVYMDTGVKSGTPVFQVNLSTGLTFKMEGEDIYISVPKRMVVTCGDRLIFNAPLTILNTQKVGAIIINAASIALNGAKETIITGAVAGFNTASTKISGVLAAGSARIATLVKGALGGDYSAASVDRALDTPPRTPSNSPDTGMSGPPYQS